MEYVVRTAEQLAPTLRAFRKELELSQRDLAQRIGVTQQALSLLEGAPERAGFQRLMSLFAALEIEVVLRHKTEPQDTPSDGW